MLGKNFKCSASQKVRKFAKYFNYRLFRQNAVSDQQAPTKFQNGGSERLEIEWSESPPHFRESRWYWQLCKQKIFSQLFLICIPTYDLKVETWVSKWIFTEIMCRFQSTTDPDRLVGVRYCKLGSKKPGYRFGFSHSCDCFNFDPTQSSHLDISKFYLQNTPPTR